ncbi:hypothetical protein AGMMS50256_37100 [Betaproteobacteria bacterium]|nr:hypothetical protein AGMMS50256_37100 [Betaproteobacteria bacterium]
MAKNIRGRNSDTTTHTDQHKDQHPGHGVVISGAGDRRDEDIRQ